MSVNTRQAKSKRLRSEGSEMDTPAAIRERIEKKMKEGGIGVNEIAGTVADLTCIIQDLMRNDKTEKAENNGEKSMVTIEALEVAINKSNQKIEKAIGDGFSKFSEDLRGMVDRVNTVEKSVDRIEKDHQMLDTRVKALEMEQVKGGLIIKNVPICKKAREEKRNETQNEACDTFYYEILLPLGLEKVIERFDAWRFPTRPGSKLTQPLLKVVLTYPTQKSALFRALSSSQNKIHSSITIKNEYPRSLREDYKNADAAAFNIRKDSHKETRTKIIMREGKVKVLVKEKNDKGFKELTARSDSRLPSTED